MLERKSVRPSSLIDSTPKLTASHYDCQAIPQLLAQAPPVDWRTD